MVAPFFHLYGDSKGGSAGNLLCLYNFRATSPFSRLGVRDHTGGPGGSLHTFSPVRKYDCSPHNDGVSLFTAQRTSNARPYIEQAPSDEGAVYLLAIFFLH